MNLIEDKELGVYVSGTPEQQYVMLIEGLAAFAEFVDSLNTHSAELGRRLPAGEVILEALLTLTEDQQKDLLVLAGNIVIAYSHTHNKHSQIN
jgi:hypothetical protein